MATTFKPSFRAASSLTWATALDSLANDSTAVSDAVDNSSNLDDEIEIEIYIDGTAAAGAWLDVRIAKSIDGGTNYGTWESAMPLPSIPLAVDLQRYHARFAAPQRFKLMVKNNTGAALAGSGNTAKYQGIQYQGV